MASRILGLGDIATLAEQAKGAFDSDTASKLESKFASGEDFTLDDFLSQLEAMKKMGSMTKLLGMLPGANSGASKNMKKQLEQFDEGELVKTQSIVQSMTPLERNDPKVLNGSRRSRIAKGSGRQVSDVNSLVERFTQAQKVMKQMRTGKGGAQLPPGMALPPGMPKAPSPKVINKKKSRSGNPAKRALES
jgi:signal recognition particle subunit SRP54